MELEVIYSDNHLLAVNKPPQLLTQPSGTLQDSLEHYAKEWIKKTCHKPGNVFLEAVHRLDKDVSGIVVFARTSKALSRLQASIRNKDCKKVYWALVEGEPYIKEGFLEHYLVHEDFRSRVAERAEKGAKLSRLQYRVLKSDNGRSLLELTLETGRYHQIRVQLSSIGNPIVGDVKYGAQPRAEEGIALHHRSMQIPHPTKNEPCLFEAELFGNFPVEDIS